MLATLSIRLACPFRSGFGDVSEGNCKMKEKRQNNIIFLIACN
jgi:hypothetical protein